MTEPKRCEGSEQCEKVHTEDHDDLHLPSTVAGGCEIVGVNTARRVAQIGEKNAFQAGNLIACVLGTPRRWLEKNIWMNLRKGIGIVSRGGLR